jgi:molybdopterin converting factor small subunit
MVEIRYGDQYEVVDIAGQTVSEAREQFKAEFGIPDKAKAKLNGSKVKPKAEFDTVLNDEDKIAFAVPRSRTPFLIGALLLALAATGGVFAFGFLNANVTLSATTHSDFASVTANTDSIGFNVWGLLKGSIFADHDLFYIVKNTSWTGDLVITVTLGNAGELAKVYRAFGLELILVDSNTDVIQDIGLTQNDIVLLSLDYPSVNMFYSGASQNVTVRVKHGFYVATHIGLTGIPESGAASANPSIYCDITQSEYPMP